LQKLPEYTIQAAAVVIPRCLQKNGHELFYYYIGGLSSDNRFSDGARRYNKFIFIFIDKNVLLPDQNVLIFYRNVLVIAERACGFTKY
jgi:hypothetical protein